MQDNYQYYLPHSADTREAYAFADASYNGGVGGLDRERRACKLAAWCDHTRWFDNVEKLCLKSQAALYGNRSACDINRYHVKDVLLVRANKYQRINYGR
jgi:membrane-bound lytic murein transglycosylase MltF